LGLRDRGDARTKAQRVYRIERGQISYGDAFRRERDGYLDMLFLAFSPSISIFAAFAAKARPSIAAAKIFFIFSPLTLVYS